MGVNNKATYPLIMLWAAAEPCAFLLRARQGARVLFSFRRSGPGAGATRAGRPKAYTIGSPAAAAALFVLRRGPRQPKGSGSGEVACWHVGVGPAGAWPSSGGGGAAPSLFIARAGASAPVAEGREEEEATATVHLPRGDERAGEGWEVGEGRPGVGGGGSGRRRGRRRPGWWRAAAAL